MSEKPRLKVYSIKLPAGLPEKLRQLYGVSLSELARIVLSDLALGKRSIPTEVSDDRQPASSPPASS